MPERERPDLSCKKSVKALEPRKAPYAHKIAKGVFVTLRVGATGESWGVKTRVGTRYVERAVAAKGFKAARKAAKAIAKAEAKTGTKVTTAHTPDLTTYGDAWRAYVAHCEASGKTDQAMLTIRSHGHALAGLFDLKIATTPLHVVNEWRTSSVGTKGRQGRKRTAASVSKNIAAMKAALNRFGVDSPFELRKWKVTAPKTAGRKIVALMDDDLRRFTDAATAVSADLGVFVRALALTGARPGELKQAAVADFRDDDLLIRFGKTSHKKGPRMVPLSPAARRFFSALTAGRDPDAPLLGRPWGAYEATPMAARAAKAAGVPGATMYSIRHGFVTSSLYRGVPIHSLAAACSTSIAMIEKTYAHVLAEREAAVWQGHDPYADSHLRVAGGRS